MRLRGHRFICSRFERKCNKERERPRADRFTIYQKHLAIWQSSLAQNSKCLLFERRPEILLIRTTIAAPGKDAQVTWPRLNPRRTNALRRWHCFCCFSFHIVKVEPCLCLKLRICIVIVCFCIFFFTCSGWKWLLREKSLPRPALCILWIKTSP